MEENSGLGGEPRLIVNTGAGKLVLTDVMLRSIVFNGGRYYFGGVGFTVTGDNLVFDGGKKYSASNLRGYA